MLQQTCYGKAADEVENFCFWYGVARQKRQTSFIAGLSLLLSSNRIKVEL